MSDNTYNAIKAENGVPIKAWTRKCYELGFDISTLSSAYDPEDYSSGRVKHFRQSGERNVRQVLQQVVQAFRFLH